MDEELQALVQAITSVILDDETLPTWSIGSSLYYMKLARYLCENDEETIEDIKRLTTRLRGMYRSFLEHSHLVSLVKYTKESSIASTVDDELCCVCLQECNKTWRRVIRLRSQDGDPQKCRHRLHKACAARLNPNEDGIIHCPLCRESLGPYICSWADEESNTPRF